MSYSVAFVCIGMAVTANRIICFRIEEELERRIELVLRSRFPTRSKLIRTAIEMLLSKEEAKARLKAAQMAVNG